MSHSWVQAGEISSDGRTLLLSDPLAGGIWKLALAPDGNQVESELHLVQHPGQSDLSLNGPGIVRRVGQGFLATEARWPRFVWLNDELAPYKGRDLMTVEAGNLRSTLVLQWGHVAGTGDIFGFGFLGRDQAPGFFGMTRGALPDTVAPLIRISVDIPKEALQYYLTLNVGASGEDAAYFWFASDPPTILALNRSGPTFLQLQSLRLQSAYSKMLPTGRPGRSIATIANDYAEMERLATPVQLVSHEGNLFVLFRTGAGSKGGQWRLVRLSRTRGIAAETGDFLLPSSASALLAVPKGAGWLLVESGPVKEAGGRELEALVFIEQKWFSANRSGQTTATDCVNAPPVESRLF